jgi:hypothetical protein
MSSEQDQLADSVASKPTDDSETGARTSNVKQHNFDTHLPGSNSKETTSTICPSTIGQIIEEEEDSEEQTDERVNPKSSHVPNVNISTTVSKISNIATPTTVTTHETTKFVLEPVVLVDNNTSATSQATNPVAADPETVEVAEIRVEEGYATRQMDEYFRQTIAAIKEELTKKLETKKEKKSGAGNHNVSHHKHNNEDYSYYETSSSEFDEDDEDEYYFDHHQKMMANDTTLSGGETGEIQNSQSNNMNGEGDVSNALILGDYAGQNSANQTGYGHYRCVFLFFYYKFSF